MANQTATQKTNVEQAIEIVRAAIKGTKIVDSEVSTGYSFFEGKKRLVKILKSKGAVSIEINVALDKATEEKFGLNKISRKTAHEKHLGTMQYMAKIGEIKTLPELMKAAVEAFKAEQIAAKAEQEQSKAV